MKLTEPFELSKYTLQHGLGLTRSATLGVETLRHYDDGLYYADMNVVLVANGYTIGKNPITYKTLRTIQNEKLLLNETDGMSDMNLGAIYEGDRGMFLVRKTDGMFIYVPEYVRGAGMHPAVYLSQLTYKAKQADVLNTIFGRYQVGTQEYVIQELNKRMAGQAWTNAKMQDELKQILDARRVKQVAYGR